MCYQNQYQRKAHKEIDEIFLKLLPEAGLSVREEQVKPCWKERSRCVTPGWGSERLTPIWWPVS